jgi:hypothetical protein
MGLLQILQALAYVLLVVFESQQSVSFIGNGTNVS